MCVSFVNEILNKLIKYTTFIIAYMELWSGHIIVFDMFIFFLECIWTLWTILFLLHENWDMTLKIKTAIATNWVMNKQLSCPRLMRSLVISNNYVLVSCRRKRILSKQPWSQENHGRYLGMVWLFELNYYTCIYDRLNIWIFFICPIFWLLNRSFKLLFHLFVLVNCKCNWYYLMARLSR